MKYRIRELTYFKGFNEISTGLYVIDEIVTNDGLYITWENKFSSTESAQKYLNKFLERQ